jgi:hypothetical protein
MPGIGEFGGTIFHLQHVEKEGIGTSSPRKAARS